MRPGLSLNRRFLSPFTLEVNMLRHLTIQDFVIVDRMELAFDRGFTGLTGETGAGKSILVDALALTLGERCDASVVRAGCERAEITAEFDVTGFPATRGWLKDNDLNGDPGVCLMRRVIDSGGRSRGFINGRPATMQQLREAGERLVDIHGQHAHQSLLRGDAQRDLLDGFAGEAELAGEVTDAYRRWHGLKQKRLAWEENAAAFAAEREQLEWQVRELKTLDFSADEWQTLQADHARLAHAAGLLEGVQLGLDALSESENACLAQLNAVASRLRGLLEYDASLKDVLDMLEPAQIQIQEAVYALRHYQQRLDLDPERLTELEQRLSAVHTMARKYRVTPQELPNLLEKLSARLDEFGAAGDGEGLKQQEQEARRNYLKLAEKLGAVRQKTARSLSSQVTASMQTLGMAGGEFAVALTPIEDGNAHGLERIEFQVSAHPGLPLRPIGKVASGGELSRISLAIQVVTSTIARVPTLIFDEVDAGIGGRVAEIVGRMLKRLGGERQVMCVTHLPQVAAAADQQWQVSKSAANGAVLSRITVLNEQSRIEEIARMLGGVKITETTRKHAAEMLGVK